MIDKTIYDFETVQGLKTIEIVCSDITVMKEPTDILIISSFQNGYKPSNGSLIGSLSKLGIDVTSLAQKPLIDMRRAQHVWLSVELNNMEIPFKHIACIEFNQWRQGKLSIKIIKKRLTMLFGMMAAADYSGIPIKKVMMPVIGSNYQDYKAVIWPN